ncbi:cpr6 [Symbiodinium natans]|uniref:Cpr6 protein n=1 Tax=Symbiodinium natans TaxID=878477 RepID=A0A812IET9_9DINO|nr:cpr6 [Symbiodinium natans]
MEPAADASPQAEREAARCVQDAKAHAQDIAFCMMQMEVTQPQILRAVPAFRVLQYFGRVLRHGGDFYHLSRPASTIDEFCSHSWHGSAWMKISLLLLMKNGVAAFVAGTLCALVMMCLFCLDMLPGYFRQPFLGTGVAYKYGPWSLLTGVLVSCLFLLLWRPKQSMFLDRICINQVDQILKAEGVLNIGAILKHSNSMLVLWDTTFASRLWCLFEIAAFLKSHEDGLEHLLIKPTYLAPSTLVISLCVTLMMLFELLVPFVSVYVVVLKLSLLALSCVTAARLLFLYYGSVRALKEQLREFRMQDAKCVCCDLGHLDACLGSAVICDREIVSECICTWFGSVDGFESAVRSRVSKALAGQLGQFPCPYSWLLRATAPVLWAHMDMVAARIHAGDAEYAVAVAIQALAWWLALFPSSLFLVAVSYKCYERPRRGPADLLAFILSLLAPVLSLAGGVGYMYACLRFIENAIVGATLFAATMLIPTVLAWRTWSKGLSEAL